MRAFFRSCIAAAAIAATSPALAADFSGTWDVAVREAGARNFYLPMTDGRLAIAPDGREARYNALVFTASQTADGLRLACLRGSKPCGDLVLERSGDRLRSAGAAGGGPAPFVAAGVAGDASATSASAGASARRATARLRRWFMP